MSETSDRVRTRVQGKEHVGERDKDGTIRLTLTSLWAQRTNEDLETGSTNDGPEGQGNNTGGRPT